MSVAVAAPARRRTWIVLVGTLLLGALLVAGWLASQPAVSMPDEATMSRAFEQVEEGMAEQEVEDLLGPPVHTERRGDGLVVKYWRDPRHQPFVVFEAGRVVLKVRGLL